MLSIHWQKCRWPTKQLSEQQHGEPWGVYWQSGASLLSKAFGYAEMCGSAASVYVALSVIAVGASVKCVLLPDIKSFIKESALLWGENTALLTCWSLWSVNKQMDKGTQQTELGFSKSIWQSPALKVGLKRPNWHRIREKVLLQIQGCLKK